MAIRSQTGSEAVPYAEAILTIILECPAGPALRRLVVRCAHGTTTLDVAPTLDAAAAERTLTAVAVLRHCSRTGCGCTRRA